MIGDDRDPTEPQFAEGESADNIDNIDNKFQISKQKQIVAGLGNVIVQNNKR